jgi:phage/plasmid-like protein (TIGR03299 family)
MSHQITSTDNMFVVREPSWHGLEATTFAEYPTRAEAQAAAHPWEPVSAPLFRRVLNPDLTESFEEVSSHTALVRSDNDGLLGVVSDTYTPVTNGELYDIAEAVQGEGADVKLETGGSLKGGSKVWLLLRLNEPLMVPGDPNGATVAYYALQNSHDGSTSLRGQATMTRIVCDNTAQAADLDAKQRGTEFVFHHTAKVAQRIEEAKLALRGWRDSVANWQLQCAALSDIAINDAQKAWFIHTFIPAPPAKFQSDRVMANVDKARDELAAILAGPTCEGINGNAYGLVQSAIEYSQHVRTARATTIEGRMESRFKRAYLDRSLYTSSAVELAHAAAEVN